MIYPFDFIFDTSEGHGLESFLTRLLTRKFWYYVNGLTLCRNSDRLRERKGEGRRERESVRKRDRRGDQREMRKILRNLHTKAKE